jgi:hypothetical protein
MSLRTVFFIFAPSLFLGCGVFLGNDPPRLKRLYQAAENAIFTMLRPSEGAGAQRYLARLRHD